MSALRESYLRDHPPSAAMPLQSFVDPERDPDVIVVRKRWDVAVDVDPFDVVGTAHPDYAGGSWLDLLQHGRRMAGNLALAETNPGYYDAPGQKAPSMLYAQVDDGPLFVDGDGNHRTAIAQMLYHLQRRPADARRLTGVTLTRYWTDEAAAHLAHRLRHGIAVQGLPISLACVVRKLDRQDGPGWMEERFEPRFRLTNVRNGSVQDLSSAAAASWLAGLQRPASGLTRFLRSILPARSDVR